MEIRRKPFQGVWNIIRFNWHFYAIVLLVFSLVFLFKGFLSVNYQIILQIGAFIMLAITAISLLVSYYIYDVSDLYQLKWIKISGNKKIININAGFDETSELIKQINPKIDLTVCDFYDEKKHTEVSIKRGRKAYPPFSNTISVQTNYLPFADETFDLTVAILSAHEIRNEEERILFFKELNRITKSSGEIIITEHLRDFNNFMAYTIGFFHFHSRKTWLKTFRESNLIVNKEIKTTPFITIFILRKDGSTA